MCLCFSPRNLLKGIQENYFINLMYPDFFPMGLISSFEDGLKLVKLRGEAMQVRTQKFIPMSKEYVSASHQLMHELS